MNVKAQIVSAITMQRRGPIQSVYPVWKPLV